MKDMHTQTPVGQFVVEEQESKIHDSIISEIAIEIQHNLGCLKLVRKSIYCAKSPKPRSLEKVNEMYQLDKDENGIPSKH
jgi:hypothetical protein